MNIPVGKKQLTGILKSNTPSPLDPALDVALLSQITHDGKLIVDIRDLVDENVIILHFNYFSTSR